MSKDARERFREALLTDLIDHVERYTGLRGEREYHFAKPERRWRSDLAYPSVRVALEIDGGTWVNGRHNHPSSMHKEMEKDIGYAMRGWKVLHCPWDWIEDGTLAQKLVVAVRRAQKEAAKQDGQAAGSGDVSGDGEETT